MESRLEDHEAIQLARTWSIRRVDHLIERERPWSITYFDVPNWALLRNIPRDWNRKNIDVRANLFLGFSMGTHEPILTCFSMAADAGKKQFSWGTPMSRAREEEKIAAGIILQNKSNTRFCTIRCEVGNRPYHCPSFHGACSMRRP